MPAGPHRSSADETGYSLRVFGLYRVFVPALLLFGKLSGLAPGMLGRTDAQLFAVTTSIYLAVALIQAIGYYRVRDSRPARIAIAAVTDLAAITLIVYSSGGGSGGLGMLMVPTIAAVGVLAPGQMAVFFAAAGSLFLLAAEVWGGVVADHFPATGFTQTGLIGASLFVMAGLAFVLAQRVRQTEVIAERRGADLADMEHLNSHIIERMSTGVIVVGEDRRVRLINHAAWQLFDRPGITDTATLGGLSPKLAEAHRQWLVRDTGGRITVAADGALPEMQVRFTRLGIDRPAGTLIFVEDTRDLRSQIQEVKLASLGRLTASIAHEIRNPLGAISHAAQLLDESGALTPDDRRLTGIVRDQAQRLNRLVQNILDLSRRQTPRHESIPLAIWLHRFVHEFRQQHKLAEREITWVLAPPATQVVFDPDHLHQILWNLCTNALRHGRDASGRVRIEIVAGTGVIPPLVTLDVIDHGQGIHPAILRRLFEPFVTGSREGTGLGLYIARELCENNGAQLTYHPVPTGGSCFRIQFPPTDERETE